MNARATPGARLSHFRFWCSTAVFACQLVLAATAAGVPPQSTPAGQSPSQEPPALVERFAAGAAGRELVRITADRQEKFGHIYHLRGNVEILFRDMRISADEVDYDDSTEDLDARGHVRFQREANHEDIQASDAHYNLATELGQFYEVRGTTGARAARPQTMVLTTTNPYYFEARRVDKISDNTYMVYDGFVTSCRPPNPFWTFRAKRARIKPGENAFLYNALAMLGNKVPFFFSPFLYHSLKRIPRSSGFLTPNIGNSSRKGRVFGDSFFWAINRSADAEFGLEYYSERGWGQRGLFRMRPNAATTLTASYFGVVDRGLKVSGIDRFQQGGRTLVVTGSSQLPHGFRAVANFNYLSSFLFRLAFTETYLDAVNTEVHSTAFVSNNFRGFSFNAGTSRFQNFQGFSGRVSSDAVDIRTTPGVEFNSVEQPVFGRKPGGRNWPLYFSFDSAAEALNRVEPRYAAGEVPRVKTGMVSRFDFFPRLSAPLHWKGLHLLASYGVRATHYGSRFQNGRVSSENLDRSYQELDLSLRPPSLERVFQSPWKFFGERIKHVVEPRASFRLVEGTRQFHEVLLFDERDLVADTRELEYGLANRLFSKRADGQVREMFSWDLAQRYFFDPTFGGALLPGQRNVFTSTLSLTGYTFLDGRRRFSPVTSRVRFMPAWNLDAEMRADYDPDRHRLVNSGVTLNMRKGNAFASLSDFYVNSAAMLQANSHQVRGMLGYGFPNRRGLNVGGTFVYDLRQDLAPYFGVQATYNFDCCGFSVEFRRFHFGRTLRDERQFRVAITFANLGTFGNLKKQERMF